MLKGNATRSVRRGIRQQLWPSISAHDRRWLIDPFDRTKNYGGCSDRLARSGLSETANPPSRCLAVSNESLDHREVAGLVLDIADA
jgi:hypothetical protein